MESVHTTKRCVYIGEPSLHQVLQNKEHGTNRIHTSHYTLLSFFPKNLFYQFMKGTNVYFLMIGVLQSIKVISTTNGRPVMGSPITMILSLSMTKDALEDKKRHESDDRENNQEVSALRPQIDIQNNVVSSPIKQVSAVKEGCLDKVKWSDLTCGDIVIINGDEDVPADLVILYSSNKRNNCYVETVNLDGETSLKIKQPVKQI